MTHLKKATKIALISQQYAQLQKEVNRLHKTAKSLIDDKDFVRSIQLNFDEPEPILMHQGNDRVGAVVFMQQQMARLGQRLEDDGEGPMIIAIDLYETMAVLEALIAVKSKLIKRLEKRLQKLIPEK